MRDKILVMTENGTILRDAQIVTAEMNYIKLDWMEHTVFIHPDNYKFAQLGDITIYMIKRFC